MPERLRAILELLAYEQRPCRVCGELLYFVQLPEGRSTLGAFRVKEHWVVVYNSEGENHASYCSGPTNKRGPEQQTLLTIMTGVEQNGFDPV